MNTPAIFGLNVLLSAAGWAVLLKLCLWPWLQTRGRRNALMLLVAPHTFIRFIGLSFLVPGVVSPALPAAFAFPAAYGDLVAGVLAIVAIVALAKKAASATAVVWIFNIWGTVDLLFAFYQGAHVHIRPETFGAAFYIPTAVVPFALLTHFLIFGVLLKRKSGSSVAMREAYTAAATSWISE